MNESVMYNDEEYLTGTDNFGVEIRSHEIKRTEDGIIVGIVSTFTMSGKEFIRQDLALTICFIDPSNEKVFDIGDSLKVLEYRFQYCLAYLRKQKGDANANKGE